MSLRRVIDLFGQTGHDVIGITDHIVSENGTMGKLAYWFNMSVSEENFDVYMDDIRAEAERAWRKYRMLVIPGVEITKNSLSPDKAAHILVLDVKEFISACWSYERIFLAARKQKALVIACHPYHNSEITALDTLFLWNNRDKYARFIDAWEIGNRNELYNVINPKEFAYVANSDFHKVNHLFSWKTVLNCRADVSAIKECVRRNRGVSITYFRT
jgi:hypothetical protein